MRPVAIQEPQFISRRVYVTGLGIPCCDSSHDSGFALADAQCGVCRSCYCEKCWTKHQFHGDEDCLIQFIALTAPLVAAEVNHPRVGRSFNQVSDYIQERVPSQYQCWESGVNALYLVEVQTNQKNSSSVITTTSPASSSEGPVPQSASSVSSSNVIADLLAKTPDTDQPPPRRSRWVRKGDPTRDKSKKTQEK